MNLEDTLSLNWKEQLRRVIRTPRELVKYIDLSEEEILKMEEVTEIYPLAITPYYASLMDKKDRNCPIRKMMVPVESELNPSNLPNFEKEKDFIGKERKP